MKLTIYGGDPEPASREEHNRLMNESVIKYRIPLQMVCPDCYLPPRMCRHLQDLMHQGYGRKKK